jgi:hypothetical protein
MERLIEVLACDADASLRRNEGRKHWTFFEHPDKLVWFPKLSRTEGRYTLP